MACFRVCLFLFFIFTNAIKSDTATDLKKCCPSGEFFNFTQLKCDKVNTTLNYNFTLTGVPNCSNDLPLSVKNLKSLNINHKTLKNYCIDWTNDEIIFLSCGKSSKPFFRKCCPYGQGIVKGGCKDQLQPFAPIFYNLKDNITVNNSITLKDFDLYFGSLCGNRNKFRLNSSLDEERSYLGTNGSLYSSYFLPLPERGMLTHENFCIDYMVNDTEDENLATFVCFSEIKITETINVLLITICLIISCVFLFATFMVYACTPKKRNFYGKTLMCYVGSLFAAYVCLAAVKLNGSDLLNDNICSLIGYCVLYAFLAAFAWLNVMSIDIWKTFRKVRQRQQKRNEGMRFVKYSVYAWSLPSILTGLCVFVDQYPNFSNLPIKPDVGVKTCWFSPEKYGIYVFFISPISILIICNIVMYIMTAWRCWRVKAEVNRMGNQCRSKFSANKDQFVLNGKLFIVMGVNWSLEIISFFAPHSMWQLSDVANALNGFFIFAIFILKKKVLQEFLESIMNYYKRLRNVSNPYSNKSFFGSSISDSRAFRSSISTCTNRISSSTAVLN